MPRLPRLHHVPPVAFGHDLATVGRALFGAGDPPGSASEPERTGAAAPAYAFASGRAGLRFALERLAEQQPARRQVVVPAYTCYSVAAAVEYAGLELVVCDVDPATLDMDPDRLAELTGPETLCVVAVHLFGCGVDLAHASRVAQEAGCHLVEDAAQAADPLASPDPRASLRLVSTGRGKPMSTAGGGFVALNDPTLRPRFDAAYARLGRSAGPVADGAGAARIAVMMVLSHPRLFWAPAALPLLRIGDTVYPDAIEPLRLGAFQQRLAACLRLPFEREWAVRRDHGAAYAAFVRERASVPQPAAIDATDYAPHRFPVYLAREHAAPVSAARRAGIYPVYPAPLSELPRVRRFCANPDTHTPGAAWIARRLVTLPTHAHVDTAARRRVLDALQGLGV